MLATFQSFTRVYGGMLGSCDISSSVEMAFDARTPIVCPCAWSASIAPLAARRMFRGVVLSFETSFRTARACFIRVSYSSFRFAFCRRFHQIVGWASRLCTHPSPELEAGRVVIKRFPFPQRTAIEKACTFTLEPVSFTIVRGNPFTPHETLNGSNFFRRVFLSGLDSGLVLLNLAHCQLVSSFLIPVKSPRDQRGKPGSRNRGLQIGIRADNERFEHLRLTRLRLEKRFPGFSNSIPAGRGLANSNLALFRFDRRTPPRRSGRIVSRVSAVLKRLNVELPEETCRTMRRVEG